MHLKHAAFCELLFGKRLGLHKGSVHCCTHTGASTASHGRPVQPAHQTPYKHSLKGSGLTEQHSCYEILHSPLPWGFSLNLVDFFSLYSHSFLSFLHKRPTTFWRAGQDWSVDSYSIAAATQTVTLIYTSLALHKEVSVSSLLQEIHEVMCYNGLMGIWALYRQEAREKQMCLPDLNLSPATQTLFWVLFLIDISLSLGLIYFFNKVK